MNGKEEHLVVSSWLVRMLATCIFGGLASIAGYMVIWNSTDAAYKSEVMVRLMQMDRDLTDIKYTLRVVPTNTQKINDLENRIGRIEDKEAVRLSR